MKDGNEKIPTAVNLEQALFEGLEDGLHVLERIGLAFVGEGGVRRRAPQRADWNSEARAHGRRHRSTLRGIEARSLQRTRNNIYVS